MWQYHVPKKRKLRKLNPPFAWIDCRLLTAGYLQAMTCQDMALYLFLALAADKNGVSFYSKEKICYLLGFDSKQFHTARHRLINLGLVAFEGYNATSPNGFYQVLQIVKDAPNMAKELIEGTLKNVTQRKKQSGMFGEPSACSSLRL
jgi:hypothetical protein